MKKLNLLWAVLLLALSFVFIACDDDPKDTPFTLTVTNYPSNLAAGKMIGASLLAETITDEQPIAVGFTPSLSETTATYTFYHPRSDSEMPDTTRTFTVSGSYFPALAEVEFINPTGDRIVYDFKGNKLIFDSRTTNHTVDFVDDFQRR